MSIGMGITEQQRSAIRQAVEDAFAPPSNVGMVGEVDFRLTCKFRKC